jgi:hypothetical protein
MSYLYNKRKPKGKYHLWSDFDTKCRMWSTGGLKQGLAGWRWVGDAPPRELCHMCSERAKAPQ